jgi:general secretion pathway protein M
MSGWLARLRALFTRLAPRERALVAGAGGLLLVAIVWFGVAAPLMSAASTVGQRVSAAEQQLAVMRRMRQDFDEVNGRLAAVEARIQKGPRGNLRTTLETLARDSAVKIESMEPQASPANNRYRETKVELSLKAVTLPQAVRYLHAIENTDQVLSVKALRMRPRADQPQLLDVTCTVSSFEPI